MRYIIRDERFHFATAFDTRSGAYVRTGILDSQGRDTGVAPIMASYPHLNEVGILGHSKHGQTGLCAEAGIGCYLSGMFVQKPNMLLEDFAWIARQCQGRTNQLALGGRGDPDQHENFEDILNTSVKHHLVPNFTTAGYGMTPEIAAICKKYCGAVAVSWYRNDYTLAAIEMLVKAGVKTYFHYVIGNNSLEAAIQRLKNKDFPKGINAVIFLLHKQTGQGSPENVLSSNDKRLKDFFAQFDKRHPFKMGMDSCTVPGIINHCTRVAPESLDTCEGARFSCYIGADLRMVPCSFDQNRRFEVQLKPTSIEDAWNSEAFEAFRNKLNSACPDCCDQALCMGGCPLMPGIVLCQRNERNLGRHQEG